MDVKTNVHSQGFVAFVAHLFRIRVGHREAVRTAAGQRDHRQRALVVHLGGGEQLVQCGSQQHRTLFGRDVQFSRVLPNTVVLRQ